MFSNKRKPKSPKPRHGSYMGMSGPPLLGAKDTWLESETLCYPKGGKTRRAYAINVETGKHQLVWCGIPDTYFSIPAKGGGWVGCEDNVVTYYPPKPKQVLTI